jgi:diguanylate cyclase (GGDEF)-like protein
MLLPWFREKTSTVTGQKREEVLLSRAVELIDYLASQISAPKRAASIVESVSRYRALPPVEQQKELPATYLLLEQYLAEVDPLKKFTRDKLREVVRSHYRPLLALPHFQLIFQPAHQQEISLYRHFLKTLLERAFTIIGTAGDNFLGSVLVWLSQIPHVVPLPLPFDLFLPLPPDLAAELLQQDSGWLTLLRKVSQELYLRLQKKLGDKVARRIFESSYQELARAYMGLDTFLLVINLLPDTLLDEQKISLLNRNQIQRVLLEKVKHLQIANEQLAEDIIKRKRIEQDLSQEKELAQVTLQSIRDAVITTNAEGYIQTLNPVAEKLTGWQAQEAQGLLLTEVLRIVHEATYEPLENLATPALRESPPILLTEPLRVGAAARVSSPNSSPQDIQLTDHTLLITRDGSEVAVDHSAAPIFASDGRLIGTVLVFRDVTQTRRMARQLVWQASHDALTGLVNRRGFEEHLERAVIGAKTQNQQHALCYLDLDRFKVVNDTCGHVAGDELLRQVAILLQTLVRTSDTVARLGGDEFGLLFYRCPLPQAAYIARALCDRIQQFRFVWQGKTFTIGGSIGLVVINAESQSRVSVLSAADVACYMAKNKGRSRVHLYQANDSELAKQQGEIQWVGQITKAFEDNRLRLYYQPIVPIAGTKLNGGHYEVLLRLIDEAGNLVSPMAFIPAAERYNLMSTIDCWVIRTLFASQGQYFREIWNRRQAQGIQQEYLCAINLSGISINDDQFIDFLHEQFALHQIPPQMICFEITETVAISNLSKATQMIQGLRELGCRFALDDFGSGMSSFTYLKTLPVDYLKIDGSFVKDIVEDPIAYAMVEVINRVGHVMGIQTIAEFVENQTIFEKIKAIGVDYAQGYSVGKPSSFPCKE